MATARGRPDAPLERLLFQNAPGFDFFQAVRLLERLAPDREPVGRNGPPQREAVRFSVHQTLAFPASEIHRLKRLDDPESPPEMTVAFLGLTGPLAVLPYCYTELVIDRARAGDRTLASFLDLFHHRLISLFYRAWSKYRPFLAFEEGLEDRPSRALFDLIGLGLESLRNRHEFPDGALLFYAGLFSKRHRPAVSLQRLLADHFGLPVEVRQFEGHWLHLEPADRSSLGASGVNNGLGTSLVLGSRVWDEQSKFRLRIGPLDFERFLALSPDGRHFRALAQLTRLYVDGEFVFDVQLILKAEDVPACQLSAGPAGPGPRLGRHAWLKSRPFTSDADQAVFTCNV